MLTHVINFAHYKRTKKPLRSVRMISEGQHAHTFVICVSDVQYFVDNIKNILKSDNIHTFGYLNNQYSMWESFDGNIVLTCEDYTLRMTMADLDMIISELKYNGN